MGGFASILGGAVKTFAENKVKNVKGKLQGKGSRHYTNDGPIPIAAHETSPAPSAAPLGGTSTYSTSSTPKSSF